MSNKKPECPFSVCGIYKVNNFKIGDVQIQHEWCFDVFRCNKQKWKDKGERKCRNKTQCGITECGKSLV